LKISSIGLPCGEQELLKCAFPFVEESFRPLVDPAIPVQTRGHRAVDESLLDNPALEVVNRHVFWRQLAVMHGNADAVIDAATNSLLTTIPLGGGAGNTVYDATSGRILVAIHEKNELAAIDPVTAKIVAHYSMPGIESPHGIALDTNAARYGKDSGQGTEVADWMGRPARWKIAFGHHPILSNGPHGNAGSSDPANDADTLIGDNGTVDRPLNASGTDWAAGPSDGTTTPVKVASSANVLLNGRASNLRALRSGMGKGT